MTSLDSIRRSHRPSTIDTCYAAELRNWCATFFATSSPLHHGDKGAQGVATTSIKLERNVMIERDSEFHFAQLRFATKFPTKNLDNLFDSVHSKNRKKEK